MRPLSLRLGAGETSTARPDVVAFLTTARELLREQEADHDDCSPLTDLISARIVAESVRVIAGPGGCSSPLFIHSRTTPIPAILIGRATPPVAVHGFALSDRIHGHFAWPATKKRRLTVRPRAAAALVLAVCIPLSFPAQAAPAAEPLLLRRVPPRPPRPVVPPAPAIESSAVPNLQAILDAMNGREAIVYVGEATATGRIVGVEGDFVTMARMSDGKIALIPKAQITEIRAAPVVAGPRDPEPAPSRTPRLNPDGEPDLPSGIGAVVTGSILVAQGIPLMLSGLVFVILSSSSPAIWVGQVVPASLLLGAGIPLLAVGTSRRRAYKDAQKALQSRRLMPAVGRTPGGGWTGGITLRF